MKLRITIILIAMILLFSCGNGNTGGRNSLENVVYHYTNILNILEKNKNSTVKGVEEVKAYVKEHQEELKNVAQALVDEKDKDIIAQAVPKLLPIYSKIAQLQKENNVLLTHPDVQKAFALIDPSK
jgi:3-dehydroquinate synthase class II